MQLTISWSVIYWQNQILEDSRKSNDKWPNESYFDFLDSKWLKFIRLYTKWANKRQKAKKAKVENRSKDKEDKNE